MPSTLKYKVKIDNFQILDIDQDNITDGKISYSKQVNLNGEETIVDILMQLDKNQNGIYIIDITSEAELYKSEFTSLAEKAIRDILNKIAFFYMGSRVGEPYLVESNCKDESMGETSISCSLFVDNENRDKKLLAKILKEIKQNQDFDKDDYTLFRAAMNNEDVVVKYMFLYQMLSFKHLNSKGNESQILVDNFIKSKIAQEKHQYQKWSDTGREETIYTRLRNQVGHFRGKTSVETRNKMTINIDELVELVKISIGNN